VREADLFGDLFAHRDETLTQRCRANGELALQGLIFDASFGYFDSDRQITQCCEIIGARAHIERPDVARELKAIRDQFGGDERREFESPLVKIHVCVQAARLFECGGCCTGGLVFVQRTRGRRKETEGIEVGAARTE
jgi:hypothetical protein